MGSGAETMGKIVFSTDDLPPELSEEARIRLWRDTCANTVGSGDLTALPDVPFSQRWEFLPLGSVFLGRSSGTMRTMVRSKRQAEASGIDHYEFSFVTSATPVTRTQRGHDAVYRAGEVAFQNSTDAVALKANAPASWLGAMVPRHQLNELVRFADDCVDQRFDPNSPVARYLQKYIALLLDDDAIEDDPLLPDHIATSLIDLVALAVGARGHEAALAKARGLRAARIKAILAEIRNGFAQTTFSAETVAQNLGLSDRYVQDLLQETGTSLSERVLEMRLQMARKMLTDHRNDARKVTDIALACGFNEVSHFNRCFRRRFGASPTQYRGGNGNGNGNGSGADF